jgi:hypothetical protein
MIYRKKMRVNLDNTYYYFKSKVLDIMYDIQAHCVYVNQLIGTENCNSK